MGQLISEIWEGLRAAGLPEVMLYLPDQSASRCHWDDTTIIGEVRVALLADQERKIVRILPVDACTRIGIASPKGTDPSGYKAIVQGKLARGLGGAGSAEVELAAAAEPAGVPPPPAPSAASPAADPAPPPVPPPAPYPSRTAPVAPAPAPKTDP